LKQYIYIATALLLLAYPLAAQHTIKGIVLEETEKGVFNPLPLASVHWAGTTIATTTDTSGIFTIPHTQGQTLLVVGYVGLLPDTLEVTPENMNNLRIVLKTGVALEEVEVTAETRGLTLDRLNPIKITTMTEKELFKAACCNLSESFETNPAVDVTISDAVTGTKQIQMLGLAGVYTQITTENMPGIRGLAAANGLGYLPGTWIESIQVTKGIGSVANGYESITGQINAEMRKPNGNDRVFANVYSNSQGRFEGNLVLGQDVSKKWSTALLLHGSTLTQNVDMNRDGYRDMPTGYQLNAVNRWMYSNMKGLSAQIGVKALVEDKTGGDKRFDGNRQQAINNGIFGANIKTERFEVWGKTGYVFAKKKYESIGFMWSALSHNQNSFFGTKTYNARQQSVYANLIYQSIIGNTNHKYRTGLSFLHDKYNEQIGLDTLPQNLQRTETVPGAFFEYTWTATPRWMIIGGLRGDYHNLFGFFATPRINARYDRGKGTVLHFTAGRGQRTANIFAENMQLLASNRKFMLPAGWQTTSAYNLKPEVAWNFGISLTTEVKIASRNATLEADVFHTRFQNQVVVDLDNTARQAAFYNLQGKSYANSAQVQLTYEPVRRFEVRLAYRYYDVKTQYQSGLLQRYLLSPHRAFINASYKTRSKWVFDATATWFGPKRLPNTTANPESLQLPVHSPSYVIVHAQITKTIGKKWDVYVGAENLLDYRQTRLIVDPSNPTGTYFDASMIWGPVQGRMVYVGARFRIKK
jgi:outer membrane receptor for ferrienterochelin and colicins